MSYEIVHIKIFLPGNRMIRESMKNDGINAVIEGYAFREVVDKAGMINGWI